MRNAANGRDHAGGPVRGLLGGAMTAIIPQMRVLVAIELVCMPAFARFPSRRDASTLFAGRDISPITLA